jgi:hypothetical protein
VCVLRFCGFAFFPQNLGFKISRKAPLFVPNMLSLSHGYVQQNLAAPREQACLPILLAPFAFVLLGRQSSLADLRNNTTLVSAVREKRNRAEQHPAGPSTTQLTQTDPPWLQEFAEHVAERPTEACRYFYFDGPLYQASMSRFHALIKRVPVADHGESIYRFFIQDLGSLNGVYVDDVKIPCARWTRLHDGARLRFAPTTSKENTFLAALQHASSNGNPVSAPVTNPNIELVFSYRISASAADCSSAGIAALTAAPAVSAAAVAAVFLRDQPGSDSNSLSSGTPHAHAAVPLALTPLAPTGAVTAAAQFEPQQQKQQTAVLGPTAKQLQQQPQTAPQSTASPASAGAVKEQKHSAQKTNDGASPADLAPTNAAGIVLPSAAATHTGKRKTLHRDASKVATLDRRTGVGMMGMPSDEVADDACAPSTSKSSMPRVRVGNRNLAMHSELIEMTDSTALYQDGKFDALRDRLEEQGFLFVRGVIPSATIAAARQKMLVHLRDKGAMREGTQWQDAFIEYQKVWDAKQKILKGSQSKKQKSSAATPSAGMMGGMMQCTPNSAAVGAGGKMIPGWTVDARVIRTALTMRCR